MPDFFANNIPFLLPKYVHIPPRNIAIYILQSLPCVCVHDVLPWEKSPHLLDTIVLLMGFLYILLGLRLVELSSVLT